MTGIHPTGIGQTRIIYQSRIYQMGTGQAVPSFTVNSLLPPPPPLPKPPTSHPYSKIPTRDTSKSNSYCACTHSRSSCRFVKSEAMGWGGGGGGGRESVEGGRDLRGPHKLPCTCTSREPFDPIVLYHPHAHTACEPTPASHNTHRTCAPSQRHVRPQLFPGGC